MFTFAICCRPSVCRLSVTFVYTVPYSAGWNFRQCFNAIWYLGRKFYGNRRRGTPPSG